VINKILFLMEIEFIVARNVARGFIPAKYSEAMVSLQGGDCHPTRRRGTRLGQEGTVSAKNETRGKRVCPLMSFSRSTQGICFDSLFIIKKTRRYRDNLWDY